MTTTGLEKLRRGIILMEGKRSKSNLESQMIKVKGLFRVFQSAYTPLKSLEMKISCLLQEKSIS